MTLAKVAESRDPGATRIDWAGLVTFSASLFMLVLALLRGNEEGWDSTFIVSLLVGAAVLMAAFIAIERRVEEPMLPLRFFKIRSFTGVQLAAFAISASQFALFLYITLYLQNILGHTPLEAGIRYLPITVVSFLFAPLAGALLGKVQARVLLFAGLLAAGVGLLLMSGVDQGSEWTTLLGGFLVGGAGIGLMNPVIADIAVSVVPDEQAGMATGINDTFRQVGVAVGIAAWGALFLARGEDRIVELAPGTPFADGERPRELIEATASGNLDEALAGVPGPVESTVANAAREGFLSGFNDILVLGGCLSLLGAVMALWLVRQDDFRTGQPPSELQPQAASA